ncbi:hypothetical protein OE378_005423, partial [Salmonella enterica]|nr:hypothetical protein [Salmonella enterica]
KDAIPPRAVPQPAARNDVVMPDQVPGIFPRRDSTNAPADAGTSPARNRANVTDSASVNDLLRPLEFHTHLHLDGKEIAETVNEYNGYDALRSTGGDF